MENSYKIGTPADEIPESDKIKFVTVKEVSDRYAYLIEWFLIHAVIVNKPDNVKCLKHSWSDKGELVITFVLK